MSTLLMRPETARERERNLLAIAMQGDAETACRLILELDDEDFTEPLGKWAAGQIVKAIGQSRGHKYHDLLADATDEQAAYLDDLQSRFVTAANGEGLLEQIKLQTRLRKARAVFSSGLERVKQGDGRAIDEALAELARILTPSTVRKIHGTYSILLAAKKRMEGMRAGKLARYIPLGMPFIERMLAIQPGHLVILAAATGIGKTALALTWTHSLAFEHGKSVLYLNSEMAPDEIGLRLVAIAKGLHLGRLRISPTENDVRAVAQMADEGQTVPAFTSEPIGELSSAEVSALTRYHQAARGLEVLVVDYIQRLREYAKPKDTPQWQMLMEISRALKVLAADRKIVVICLAQFNSMGELAASKGMANDADLVLGLERCGAGGPPTERYNQTHLLTVVKGRHIATGLKFYLRMDPDTLRFTELLGPEEAE